MDEMWILMQVNLFISLDRASVLHLEGLRFEPLTIWKIDNMKIVAYIFIIHS